MKKELKHVKIIEGYNNLIKHKFKNYLGIIGSRNPVFEGNKFIYIFSEYSLESDQYDLSQLGLKAEAYYIKPKFKKRAYKVFLEYVSFGMENVKKLKDYKIISEEIFSELVKNEKENKKEYADKQIKTLKANLAYYERIKNESNS